MWTQLDSNFNNYQYNPDDDVGINSDIIENMSSSFPIDFYHLFVDDEVIKPLVEETNCYAQQCLRNVVSPQSPKWNEYTPTEIKNLLGIIMWIGLLQMPNIYDYWRNDTL